MYREAVIATPLSTLPNLVVLAFWIVNYVVNIGFGKSWGRWPSYVSAIVILASATLGWLIDGSPDNPILGACIWLWLMYFYAHLGLSFLQLHIPAHREHPFWFNVNTYSGLM
jgi:hypothetical protein